MLESLIATFCFNLQGDYLKYSSSCNSAVKAAYIQTGVQSNIDNLTKYYEQKIVAKTGKEVWFIGITTLYVIKNQEFILNTNIRPFADNLSVVYNKDTVNGSLSWQF